MSAEPDEVVLRHKNTHVGKWVVPVPLGSTAKQVAEKYAESGWSLDEKTDPADVPSPADRAFAAEQKEI